MTILFANTIMDTGRELLERLNGPLNFRLIVMPIVVSVLAIRAGLKDAREGQPTFLCGIVTTPRERSRLVRSALADIGKIFIVAIALDTAYQLMIGEPFRVKEVLFVAVACAIVPYLALRGPIAFLARGLRRSRFTPGNPPAASNDRLPPKPNANH